MKKKTKLLLGILATSILSTFVMVGTGFYYFWSIREEMASLILRVNRALDEYATLLPVVRDTLRDLGRLQIYVNATVQNMIQEGFNTLLQRGPVEGPVRPPQAP